MAKEFTSERLAHWEMNDWIEVKSMEGGVHVPCAFACTVCWTEQQNSACHILPGYSAVVSYSAL
jgi:hypothetical protein